jgi:hypothetical protein
VGGSSDPARRAAVGVAKPFVGVAVRELPAQ